MTPLRALIVDDEPLARERLRRLLRDEAAVEIVGECGSSREALAAIQHSGPDLVFLDVQMPGGDGFRLVEQLAEPRPSIVFVTAHERYALEAFKVAAVDFLLKPFDRERLGQAIRRAQSHQLLRQIDGGARPAEPTATATTATNRVAFKSDGRLVFFRTREIVWVEADDNYVVLHLPGGRLTVRETLSTIEERLAPAGFARVNRSALVQVDEIREIQPAVNGDSVVVLRDGTRLTLSRALRGKITGKE